MEPFRNKEEMVRILSALWDEIFNSPEIVRSVSNANLIAKFRYTDFKAALFIDISGDMPKYYWDPGDSADFDVEMILSSQTSHLFWMEDLNVPLALATRKIVAKGSIQKALKLLPAIKPAFSLYPEVLKRMGRDDLLLETGKKKRKHRFRLFKRKQKKAYRLDLIPSFPADRKDESKTKPLKQEITSKLVTDRDLLHTMLKIRSFEQHLSQAFKEGSLPTEAIHLSIGQEGVAAGVCMSLKETDYLNTTHRGHGHIIAKGADINRMMAEIYGKQSGLCKGKGGSMHVTDGNIGVLGANGIVGAGYLLALGAGFTIKHYEKSNNISVVIAGDGSVNQGMFHEAMNIIGVFQLPVLVVIENNRYGEFTSIDRHSAVTEVHMRAKAYGIKSSRFDGNNVRTVFSEINQIIEKMREDGRPFLVELMTYRWHGHMEGDAETYRTDDERKGYYKDDPIRHLEDDLTREGNLSKEELEKIHQGVTREIEGAVRFASDSSLPPESDLLTDIYTPDESELFAGTFELKGDIIEMSVSQAINLSLAEEMERDRGVFLWGEDVTLGGYFNVTEGLVERFGPDRIIDTPISENGIIGGAVGAAMTGMRPVSEILFADFLSCCMDPILNQASKLRYMTGGQVSVPMTIRAPLGSGIGMAAQHSQSMEKFFFGIPGLMVVAPSDAFTAKGILASAIRSNNPVLVFEHKLLYAESGKVPANNYTLPIGKARIVRNGKHVTIVTFLLGVGIAKDASSLLQKSGIETEIIDLVTLYPMDTKTILESVLKTGYLLTLEEGHFSGSIGSEVISRVALAGFGLLKKAPVKIAAPECPIPYAKNLENVMLPTSEMVAEAVERMLD